MDYVQKKTSFRLPGSAFNNVHVPQNPLLLQEQKQETQIGWKIFFRLYPEW